MPAGLRVYRAAATMLGAAAPILRSFGTKGGAWRDSFTGAGDDLAPAAGSVWIHASSLGEVVAARVWAGALLEAGYRAPLILTTRTARGLARARAELGARVVARIAPVDLPQIVRSFLDAAAPWRLDIVETEIWPHLVLETRRRDARVLFVSASVSERTRRRLQRFGLAGPRLLGEGVWVLAQSDRHAGRFRALGVPADRIAVTGDLKAEPPVDGAERDPLSRPAVVFGSLRPGEEAAALALARVSEAPGGDVPVLLVAPRHRAGLTRVRAALRAAGIAFETRSEAERARESLDAWIARLGTASPRRVGLLATQGELPSAYERARVAVVGGTFAPYGGHNVLEPAARGCPVLVGPHTDSIEAGIEALGREEGVLAVSGAGAAAEAVRSLLSSPGRIREMARGAIRAASGASLSAERSIEALGRFGLGP
jgi:3-deoxy-D-manno-octulosonic-acid transferase